MFPPERTDVEEVEKRTLENAPGEETFFASKENTKGRREVKGGGKEGFLGRWCTPNIGEKK